MIARREFLIGATVFGALAACQPAGPGSVTIVANGTANMNTGADGAGRPLTLQIMQLRGTGTFDTADFFALQDPATALGSDLAKVDQIAVAPGGSATKTIGLESGVTMIGVIAGYRDPTGKVFRVKSAVSPTDAVTFQVNAGENGIELVPA